MVGMDLIKELSDAIAREFRPERIVLFGSYAYGKPSTDSDVDLLVIMPFTGKSVHKALEIINKIQPKFSVDLLVRRQDEVEWRIANNDCFMSEIVEQGRTLYESDNA